MPKQQVVIHYLTTMLYIIFAAIFIQFSEMSYTVSEVSGSVTVGITASAAPHTSATFEVVLQDATAKGMGAYVKC